MMFNSQHSGNAKTILGPVKLLSARRPRTARCRPGPPSVLSMTVSGGGRGGATAPGRCTGNRPSSTLNTDTLYKFVFLFCFKSFYQFCPNIIWWLDTLFCRHQSCCQSVQFTWTWLRLSYHHCNNTPVQLTWTWLRLWYHHCDYLDDLLPRVDGVGPVLPEDDLPLVLRGLVKAVRSRHKWVNILLSHGMIESRQTGVLSRK